MLWHTVIKRPAGLTLMLPLFYATLGLITAPESLGINPPSCSTQTRLYTVTQSFRAAIQVY
jgi:hypothetical protein